MYFKQFICRNIIYFAVCLIFSSQLAFATHPDRMCRRAQWPPRFFERAARLIRGGNCAKRRCVQAVGDCSVRNSGQAGVASFTKGI